MIRVGSEVPVEEKEVAKGRRKWQKRATGNIVKRRHEAETKGK